MIISSRAHTALLTLALFAGLASAASPTSFCKCTCFTNSTIIPLNAPSSANRPYTDHSGSDGSSSSSSLLFPRWAVPEENPADGGDPQGEPGETPGGDKGGGGEGEKDGEEGGRKEYRAGNCGDCNKQFCLDYNLPICKGAVMDDVFTVCFQRDSRKDEAVVFIFIAATVGLLAWAAVRPWVGKWYEQARERRSYIPVSAGEH